MSGCRGADVRFVFSFAVFAILQIFTRIIPRGNTVFLGKSQNIVGWSAVFRADRNQISLNLIRPSTGTTMWLPFHFFDLPFYAIPEESKMTVIIQTPPLHL
jgi:hypothetical protein